MTANRSRTVHLIFASIGCVCLSTLAWFGLRPEDRFSFVDESLVTDGVETVTRGTFVGTVRVTGRVEAVGFSSIRAPRLMGTAGEQLVVTWLIPKGVRVRAGDRVVEFDRQNQIRLAEDARAEWLELDAQIRKTVAEQQALRAKDDAELKTAENAVARAELDVQTNGFLSAIDAEKNLLARESAKAVLAQLRETFSFKRRVAEFDLKILDVQRARQELLMRQAEANAERMISRAPMDGLSVYRNFWRDGQRSDPMEGIRLGPGAGVLDVVATDPMRVRVKVNQADVRRLRVGQAATVHLDGYPERTYKARLDHLAPTGLPGTFSSAIRTFGATFRIEQPDSVLMPNLSAAVDVEVERLENVLTVSRSALEFRRGGAFLLVKRGPRAPESMPVTVGPMSDLRAVITGGVIAGTDVIRSVSTFQRVATLGGT